MAQSLATSFRDITAQTARIANDGLTAAKFENGMNNGSNCPGIGIAIGQTDLHQDPAFLPDVGDPASWTLLDQFSVDRSPQKSESIGGVAYTAKTSWPGSGGASGNGTEFVVALGNPTRTAVVADPSLDGTVTVLGTADLVALAAGWVNL